MTNTEIRSENPQAETMWHPRFLSDKGVWICEKEERAPDGTLHGIRTWGANMTPPGGETRFATAHFPAEAGAQFICDGLNGEPPAELDGATNEQ